MVGDIKRGELPFRVSSESPEDFTRPKLLLRMLLKLVVTSDKGPMMIEVQCCR